MKLSRAFWNGIELDPPYFEVKKSSKSLTLERPISSRDVELGTTSITPHYRKRWQVSQKRLPKNDNKTNARSSGCHPIWVKVQRKSNTGEDVFEHSNDLQSEYILTTVVSHFKNRLLPNIVLRACLTFLSC